jgi:hypothetical protein
MARGIHGLPKVSPGPAQMTLLRLCFWGGPPTGWAAVFYPLGYPKLTLKHSACLTQFSFVVSVVIGLRIKVKVSHIFRKSAFVQIEIRIYMDVRS